MAAERSGSAPAPVGVGVLIDDLGSGGAQRQLVELVCRLDPRRFAPRVYYYREPCFHAPTLDAAAVAVRRIHKRPGFDPRVTAALLREARRHRLGILHGFLPGPNLYAALAARLLPGCVSIASERSNRPDQPLVLSALEAAGYHATHHVIANSHGGAARLTRRYRLPTDKVTVIPNGVDLARFAQASSVRDATRCQLDIAADERLLLMVGRPSEEKNHRLVIEALSSCAARLRRPWRLLVLGGEPTGALAASIQAVMQAGGIAPRVRFLPPQTDVERYYAACDALVLASQFEGCPNVVMEAAAGGRPVLASKVGDVAYLVRDGVSGFVFAPGDVQALARLFERLDGLPDAALREMGQAGALLMRERFGLERMVTRTMETYDMLLGARRCVHLKDRR